MPRKIGKYQKNSNIDQADECTATINTVFRAFAATPPSLPGTFYQSIYESVYY